ncbi:MAG: tetratricopeptide repeat-containing glycosyltransferase family protein [Azospirillaceae bacterium]|nr:tetratricopeptide repeat-containing glycosyltransferase family protein [Azospirillaceae bacterium]
MTGRSTVPDSSQPRVVSRLTPSLARPVPPPLGEVPGLLAQAEACYAAGDARGAAQAYVQVIAAVPQVAELYNMLGMLLFDLGCFDDSVTVCRQALALRPDFAEAYFNLGNGLRTGLAAPARAAYHRARRLGLDTPDLFNNLGVVTARCGAFDAAIAAYRQAVCRKPDHAGAFYNLGSVLYACGDTAAAVRAFGRTLRVTPDDANALNNLGSVLQAQGRLDDAIATYDRALLHAPADPRIHVNRAMALLHRGRLVEGWDDYEWRWKTERFHDLVVRFPQPEWAGEPLSGRTILLYGEQGFGDTLQFARFAPVLAARGARVILRVRQPLVRLLCPVAGVADVVAMEAPLPPFDCHLALMSVPRLLRTGLAAIPATVPYLAPPAAAVAAWRARVAALPGVKVGLVWSGDPLPSDRGSVLPDLRRSIPAAQLAGLARVGGVSFVSLQKKIAVAGVTPEIPAQIGTMPAGIALHDWMDEIDDFADTAALVAGLDLVITIDTAVAHLVGAMGKPVWILIRHDACWRWMQDRDDSPWYPSARLFRQVQLDDWWTVVEQVSGALAQFVDRHGAAPVSQS